MVRAIPEVGSLHGLEDMNRQNQDGRDCLAIDLDWLEALEQTLDEWDSKNDERDYRDL